MGLVARYDKKNAIKLVEKLTEHLRNKGLEVYIEDTLEGKIDTNAKFSPLSSMKTDFIITIGGDGTILRTCIAAPKPEPPILAINMGVRGFLTEVEPKDAFIAVEKCLKGEYKIEKCFKLTVSSGEAPMPDALNDVVISQRDLARLLTINTFVNDEYITTYQADGLIICTPTGSTAYSLSAGGPIVEPDTDVILMTPICPHTLTNRPILLPPDSKIKIELPQPENEVALTIDGQIGITVRKGDVIEVKRHSKHINLIKSSKSSFFQILRKKLGWGGSKGVQ